MSTAPSVPDAELLLASRVLAPGLRRSELSVPAIQCGACVARIERLLGTQPQVERARANLSTRRVTVDWRGEHPPGLIALLGDAGYPAHLHDPAIGRGDGTTRELVRALAVAGFAAGNIMMLSVAVWAGADAESRDIFHWLSAAIALPALAYSGRVFFRSAWQAVRHGRTNMDVPVSIGVLLAFGMSLYETIHHGPYAYF
ncbi:MAG: heavy metal translocating P-type ATPase, partial [Alphaproteobacteria bacterium]